MMTLLKAELPIKRLSLSELIILLISVFALSCPTLASAQQVVADLVSDYYKGDGTFPKNWSFLWNANGPIGTAENYEELIPSKEHKWVWVPDKENAPKEKIAWADSLVVCSGPNSDDKGYIPYLVTHPGQGAADAKYSRYVIFAYMVQKGGNYRIDDGELSSTSKESDGLDYRIYINDSLKLSGLVKGNSTGPLAGDLGSLESGDKIYVCVGPNQNALFDQTHIRYKIVLIP